MLSLETIRARLAAQCAALTSVKVAADVGGVLALQACNPPQAFVGDYQESYAENFALSNTAQKVTATFAVWLAVRRATDATGETWQAALATPAEQARLALLDWEPTTEYSPFTLTGARLESISRHVAYWRMEFSTSFISCNTL
jgi:hypothetical protein